VAALLVGAGIVPAAAAVPSRAATAGRSTAVFGYSVQHRPLVVTTIGDPMAVRRILVVGCVHGNECAARAVVSNLLRTTPPVGAAYFLIPTLNPDGAAAHTRQNAHGVDLNKNFASHWKHNGHPGSTYYSGPRPLSEPESRAMVALLKQINPTLTIWYHQHLDVVDYCGGSTSAAREYAAATGMRLTRLPRHRGSVATWEHLVWPHTSILTVELPARVTIAAVRRHAAAVRLAALVAPGVPSVPDALRLSVTDTSYLASWRAVAGNGASVDGYEVADRVRRVSGAWSAWTTVLRAGSARSHRTAAEAGSAHQVRLRARNAVGWGQWSPAFGVTVAAGP